MSTSNSLPSHPLERPEIIRALVGSQRLSSQGLFALSLVSKAIFRLVHQERRRLMVRTIPFADHRNPVRCAIENDWPEGLDSALRLGEFDNDTTSLNGRLLHSYGKRGVHFLLVFCIESGSIRCFELLVSWVNRPESPFFCDLERAYQDARRAALCHGKLNCLLYLMDNDEGERAIIKPLLYRTLLERARSPAAVAWLSRRMVPTTDYLSILITHCSRANTQPAVIEVLVDLVPMHQLSWPAASLTESANDSKVAGPTALSAAASILHIPAINLLLRRGARAFDPYKKLGITASALSSNPLFTALSHPLPRQPPPPPPMQTHDSDSDSESDSDPEEDTASIGTSTTERNSKSPRAPIYEPLTPHGWHTQTNDLAASLHATVSFLADVAALELRAPEHKPLLQPLLDRAAMVHLHNLRGFLLENLPWLLEHNTTLKKKLLRPARVGRQTAWTVASGAPPFSPSRYSDGDDSSEYSGFGGEENGRGGKCDETRLGVTWRGGLSGTEVRAELKREGVRLAGKLEEVWVLLMTGTTVATAREYLKVRSRWEGGGRDMEGGLDVLWELLVAEERGPSGSLVSGAEEAGGNGEVAAKHKTTAGGSGNRHMEPPDNNTTWVEMADDDGSSSESENGVMTPPSTDSD